MSFASLVPETIKCRSFVVVNWHRSISHHCLTLKLPKIRYLNFFSDIDLGKDYQAEVPFQRPDFQLAIHQNFTHQMTVWTMSLSSVSPPLEGSF